MSLRDATETVNLAELYAEDVLPWSRALEALHAGMPKAATAAFLGTVRPDGRPHAAGVGPALHDDTVYVCTGAGSRKGRNLAANPACTLSLRLEGIDLVLEAEARRVTDAETLEAVAAVYREGGWPATVDGDALTAPYSAQSAGPAPWSLYRLDVHTAFGVATAPPHGASRWHF